MSGFMACAYCMGRGKGVTLKWDGLFMKCQEKEDCNKRYEKLSKRDREYLQDQRLKIVNA